MARHDVRILASSDAGLLREMLGLFGRAFEDPERYGARQPTDAYLARLLARDTFVAIAAIADGHVIGGLAGYVLHKFEQECSEVYIYDLAVDEPHRRQGVATAMIERLKQYAREAGAWVIYVQADLGDDPAISLYAGLGVREDVLHFDIDPQESGRP